MIKYASPIRAGFDWNLAGLGLTVATPSLYLFQKYLGVSGALVFLGYVAVILLLGRKYVFDRADKLIGEKAAFFGLVLTLALAAMVVLVLYPISQSGVYGGGSDGADALDVATERLLHGEYPYYAKTYLNNPISPLPGALIYAAPFVLLGSSALINVFGLGVFMFSLRGYVRGYAEILVMIWTALAISPGIIHELAIGNDYVSNGLCMLLTSFWLIRLASAKKAAKWTRYGICALTGLGLSWRPNFLMIMPLLFSCIARKIGLKAAVKYLAVIGGVAGVATLPFYFYDPSGFSPSHVTQKMNFDSILPHTLVVVLLLNAALASALALRRECTYVSGYLKYSAIVLALPVLCGTVLTSIAWFHLDFSYTRFGVFYLCFGLAGFWPGVGRVDDARGFTDRAAGDILLGEQD